MSLRPSLTAGWPTGRDSLLNTSTRVHRRRQFLAAMAAIAVLAAVVLVVVRPFDGPANTADSVTVTGDHRPAGLKVKTTDPLAPPFAGLTAASKLIELAPSGPLGGDVTVKAPLLRKPGSDDVVMVFTAEGPGGPWTPIGSHLATDGHSVSFSTDHFSLFGSFFASAKDLLSAAKSELLDGLDGGLTKEAAAPSCADEAGARTGGWSVTSDSKDTIYWCFGRRSKSADSGRFVTVVNRRRYPLLVAHPNMTETHSDTGDGLQSFSRFLNNGSTVVFPAKSATFDTDIAPGQKGELHTEFDGVGQSLYQIDAGVRTLLSLLTRFGAGSPDTVVDVTEKILSGSDCASTVKDANGGDIIAKCFSPKQILVAFGAKALFLAPLMTVGPVLQYFRSESNAIFDQLNQRDDYRVEVSRMESRTTTTTTTLSTPSTAVGTTACGPVRGYDWAKAQNMSCEEAAEVLWNARQGSSTQGFQCETKSTNPDGGFPVIATCTQGNKVASGSVFDGQA